MNSQENHRKFAAKLFGATRLGLGLGVMGLSLLISAPAVAQITGATLSGTVVDATKAVIPKAGITVRNVATGVSNAVAVNADGFYTVPNLQPGNYDVTVTAPGFDTQVSKGIHLEVGAREVLNISMKVGATTVEVQVMAAAADVQLASSDLGAVVGRRAVVELPLNGRSWTDLAALEPGAVSLTTQTPFDNLSDARGRAGKGLGQQTAINGARPGMINYRLDGVSVNDYTNNSPSNASGETSGVDAIEEFSVLTANYGAEYGRSAGGVINAITRSGTNRLHGSAYDFLRNSALDARNYFDGPAIPAFRRNQFGGSVGGPILKDRTFFFVNYEGLRQLQGVTIVNVVPSAAARGGSICSRPDLVATGTTCSASTVTVDPAPAAYLPFFPSPNGGLLPTGHGDTGFFNFAGSQTANYNLYTGRIDHDFSQKDRISGTYMLDSGPFQVPDNFDDVVLGFTDKVQTGSIQETHMFSPSLANTARFGVFRQFATASSFVSAPNPLVADTTLGYKPGSNAGQVKIGGIATFSGGADAYGPQTWALTSYQAYDDASWVRGKHTLQFGFAFERQDYNYLSVPIGGIWSFGSLTTFLTNAPSSFQAQPTIVNTDEWGIRDSLFGGYVHDDWRLRTNLTLNLGLRYEMLTNPSDVKGNFASLANITDAMPRVGNGFYVGNPTLRNFEPRVGFAWDPFGNGKSSVKAAFGIYDILPMPHQIFRELSGKAPIQLAYAATDTASAAKGTPASLKGTFYNGVASHLTPSTLVAEYVQSNPGRSYLEQWNLSVEQQLASTMTATVSYVGSHGVHLPMKWVDGDDVAPSLSSAGWLYPHPVGSGTKINPTWGQIQSYLFTAYSSYHALLARVNKRMSHGVQFEGSYTYGRSIDDNSSSVSSSDFNNSNNNGVLQGMQPWKGPSDFNVGQTFSANAIWQIPDIKALHGISSVVVNGWQLGAIYRVAAGVPFTPTFGTGGNTVGAKTLASATPAFPNRLSGAGCNTATHPGNAQGYINLQCFSLPTAPDMTFWLANCDTTSKIYGSPATTAPFPVCMNLRGNSTRNSLIGPGLSNLNFSVYKNNRISDKFNAQFRVEAFNVLNRSNFSPPSLTNSDLYNGAGVPSGAAGILTTTATTSRQVQFALKLVF